MNRMTKNIIIRVDSINKATDQSYVYSTLDSIIDSLYDFPEIVTNINIIKDKVLFYIKFNLKVSKTGDLVQILIKEWLNTIYETEDNVEISISEKEEDQNRGITYKFFNYIPTL